MQQPTRVDVRWEWINQGWEMYSKQMANWIIMSLVVFLISLIPAVPLYIFIFASMKLGSHSNPQDIAEALRSSGLSIMTTLVASVVSAFLQAFSYSGFYNAAMKQLRNEQISIADFFAGMQHFVPILGLTGILAAIQFVGNLFCCLGTIFSLVTMGLLMFAYPLIVDRKLGTIQAITASLDVTKQNALMFILFGIVAHLIGGIGVVVCCVGVIFTVPMLFTTVACAYRDCYNSTPGNDSFAPPPPPDYDYNPPPSSWQ